MPESRAQKYTVPIAIVGAGALIAGAIYFHYQPLQFDFFGLFGSNTAKIQTYNPPTATDHILGNPGAPIKIVEYCDIAASYCVRFQNVMNSVMATYGQSGQVAWIYRHLPLKDIDPAEHDNAVTSECAAAEGGSAAFFGFINAIATTTSPIPSYQQIAASLSLPADDFSKCLTTKQYDSLITRGSQEAMTAGATGAPFSVLVIAGKAPVGLNGFLTYNDMVAIIEKAKQSINLQ